MTDLTGKTAVITGSTSGIGLGLARGFAQAGANVVLNGFGDAAEIERTRADLDASAAGQVSYDSADMTKPDQIEALINTASAHGLVASPFKSAYVTAKHGVVGMSKTIALEVAEDGITCNAICPGYVLTPLVEKQIPDTAKSRGMTEKEVKRNVLLAAQWTKKVATVEQLAGVAVSLCSEVAENITGVALPVDGRGTAV
ncbi:SDR family oxidoreductase [Primorskyibacter sp. S187A]|uniref:SDR family oxidoreductase n=1 Tax=Primorskyibacter sp. S187A TaxID=3415130 RepID=UPI003C7B243F